MNMTILDTKSGTRLAADELGLLRGRRKMRFQILSCMIAKDQLN